MRFEWDTRKAASNLAKHGVGFETATAVFVDPCGLVSMDGAHSTAAEERRWLIGKCDAGVLVVVYTIRQPEMVCRLISARPANRRERFRYEEAKGIPV